MDLKFNQLLLKAGNHQKKDWWENYLKEFNLVFYGIPMVEIRSMAQSFWDSNELDFDFIMNLFKIPVAEPKLAGIILLETRYLDLINEEQLTKLVKLFDDGDLSDWHICDWFCIKFLSKLLTKPQLKEILIGWSRGKTIWQKRASVVMFVPKAKSSSLEEAKEMVQVASIALGTTRFEQTGVGWLMAELSITHKELVIEWIDQHHSLLIKEALDRASKRLPKGSVRTITQTSRMNSRVSKKKK
jgi:3-methyladenine DNA glycosylase AlkD